MENFISQPLYQSNPTVMGNRLMTRSERKQDAHYGYVKKFNESKKLNLKKVGNFIQDRKMYDLGKKLPPWWPVECLVLEEKIYHIPYVPLKPEKYHTGKNKIEKPMPLSLYADVGTLVYEYKPVSVIKYFLRAIPGGTKAGPIIPQILDTLQFESRFESGNLEKAIKINESYYELYIRPDLFTNKFSQWFYFRVTNMKKNLLYRFSIVNFSKEDSLFNSGMRILMYSTKDAENDHIGWRRSGNNIAYYCNNINLVENPNCITTYTLTFTITFPYEGDAVYFAYSYPYTYSDLEYYLNNLVKDETKSKFTTVNAISKSLAGNNIYSVTITSPSKKRKTGIVLTARVHPGETPSSWVMKGCLDFLTSDNADAKKLRDLFKFKIVPMLNPDGVIVGNSRCSLSGKDLNRQYQSVFRNCYPSIYHTKLMIKNLLEEYGVSLYCDIHAHSRAHNIFIYGCESKTNIKLYEHVFPILLQKNAEDKFSFDSCSFTISELKKGTGRAVMNMIGINNSFTLECSFCGTTVGKRARTHFSIADFEEMGKSFCKTLLDYLDDDPNREMLRNKIINKLGNSRLDANETNIEFSDASSDKKEKITKESPAADCNTSKNNISANEKFTFIETSNSVLVLSCKFLRTAIQTKLTHHLEKQITKTNL